MYKMQLCRVYNGIYTLYTIYTLYIIQLTVYKYHNRRHIRNTTDCIKAKQVAVYTLYNIHDTTGSVYSILYSV